VDSGQLAATLGVSREPANKYRKEFREIERLYPEKLDNFRYRLPKKKYVKPTDPRYPELFALLPGLMEQETTVQVQVIPLWKSYRIARPKGCSLNQFG